MPTCKAILTRFRTHLPLRAKVAGRIADGRVLELILYFLKQDIMEDMTRWTPTSGCPQGAVISPLLANLYLHELDVEMRKAGLVMVRYADDAVVLCRTRERAEAALTRLRIWVDANGLKLHPDKTHVGDCRLDGQGFEFLGYRFEAGERWVRKKSLMGLRDKIRILTKRNWGDSIEGIIASINPILRGWFGYFQHAHRYTFSSVDGFVRRRLRAILRRQLHRPGQGHCLRDHTRWPMPSSLILGCSRCPRRFDWRADPDVETTHWRAGRGRTAHRVRREGRRLPFPAPIRRAMNGRSASNPIGHPKVSYTWESNLRCSLRKL
jgi:hypothetical protein